MNWMNWVVLDTLKQHYFIDRYPQMRSIKLIVSDNVHYHCGVLKDGDHHLHILFLQRWRNVPAHLKLHADWSSDPPRELHQCGTLAGGGKVLRASWSVLSFILWLILINIFTPAELVSYLEGLQRGASTRISPATNGASSPPHTINGPSKTSRKGQVIITKY